MNIEQIKEELKVFGNIQLNEATHKYTWLDKNGNEVVNRHSMTELIHKYTQPFNQKEQAKIYAEKHFLDVKDVLRDWKLAGDTATTKGTAIHNYLEYLFKNIPKKFMYNVEEVINKFGIDIIADKWEKLTHMAEDFHKKAINFLIPIACELKIKDEETGMAGAIDLLALHIDSGDLVIVDYKSGKEIRRDNIYNKFMLKPFNYLADINHVHYSLQLNGYQYILEKNTKLKLRNNHFIIWIYEGNDEVEIIPTLNLYDEAKKMIEMECIKDQISLFD